MGSLSSAGHLASVDTWRQVNQGTGQQVTELFHGREPAVLEGSANRKVGRCTGKQGDMGTGEQEKREKGMPGSQSRQESMPNHGL